MKFTCTQKDLNQALTSANRVTAKKSTLEITQNVLIETDEGMLKLTTTNLQQTLSLWSKAVVEEPGRTTVPAKMLAEFVASLEPDAKVTLEIEETGALLNVTSGLADADFHVTDPENFPQPKLVHRNGHHTDQEFPDPTAIELDPPVIRKVIGRIACAAATEDTRPVLTGVQMKVDGNTITLAAADGFRLAAESCLIGEEAEEMLEAIIPASTMQEMDRLLAGEGAAATIYLTPDRRCAMLKVEHPDGKKAELTAQLLQGTFPEYERLIPTSFTTKVTLDTAKTARGVRTAAIFAKDSANLIRLHLGTPEPSESGPMLTLSGNAEQLANGSKQVEIIDLEGEPNHIAFNSRYLQDLMPTLDSDRMTLEMTTPSSPGVFRMADNDSFTMVIMPMFVQW